MLHAQTAINHSTSIIVHIHYLPRPIHIESKTQTYNNNAGNLHANNPNKRGMTISFPVLLPQL